MRTSASRGSRRAQALERTTAPATGVPSAREDPAADHAAALERDGERRRGPAGHDHRALGANELAVSDRDPVGVGQKARDLEGAGLVGDRAPLDPAVVDLDGGTRHRRAALPGDHPAADRPRGLGELEIDGALVAQLDQDPGGGGPPALAGSDLVGVGREIGDAEPAVGAGGGAVGRVLVSGGGDRRTGGGGASVRPGDSPGDGRGRVEIEVEPIVVADLDEAGGGGVAIRAGGDPIGAVQQRQGVVPVGSAAGRDQVTAGVARDDDRRRHGAAAAVLDHTGEVGIGAGWHDPDG